MTREEAMRSWARANGIEVFVRLLRVKRFNEANGTHGMKAKDVPCEVVTKATPPGHERGQDQQPHHEFR